MQFKPNMRARKSAPDAFRHYAQIYDALKGNRAETIERVQMLMHEYCPHAQSILDLACGTGSVLQGFADGPYSITGLDSSASMLERARQKLPDVPFIQADMVDFKLERKFDVIYCVHNSVNHLLDFRQWTAMFHAVHTHLQKGGVFIFDMSTCEKLDELTSLLPSANEVGDDYAIIRVLKDALPERYHWELKIFLHHKKNKFVLHRDRFDVSAYPVAKVADALAKEFAVKKVLTLDGATNFDDKNRVFFACVKV